MGRLDPSNLGGLIGATPEPEHDRSNIEQICCFVAGENFHASVLGVDFFWSAKYGLAKIT